jgi:hypothetical protein
MFATANRQSIDAKYYPEGDVLKANPVVGMSYARRSRLHGVNLLRKGIIWRIGDDTQVKIWEDPCGYRDLGR